MLTEEFKSRLTELKAAHRAIILAHYYAPAETQAIADRVGDSFALARAAADTDAKTIVFCGVGFMGESAKLLCPDRRVLLPAPTADCPMAHMVRPGRIEELRREYPGLTVACYINSSADLKAQSDVCVTSSNALKIISRLPGKDIFFIPDRNLGRYVAEQLPEKNIILNDGCCPIHAALTPASVAAMSALYPNAEVLAHPECEPELLAHADMIGSTAEIISYVKESKAEEFIVCTEVGVAYRLECDNPGKRFHFPEPAPVCADMKLITPEALLRSLEEGIGEVVLDEALAARARPALERMMELGK